MRSQGRGEDFAISDGLAELMSRATSPRTDYATMFGRSWLRTRNSRWRVQVQGECDASGWYPSRIRFVASIVSRRFCFLSDVT